MSDVFSGLAEFNRGAKEIGGGSAVKGWIILLSILTVLGLLYSTCTGTGV
jgi:hypothetical protein